MEDRVGRTLRVFLLVLAAAGFHRLTVVPLVEPRVHDPQEALDLSPEQAAAIRSRADRRLAALGDLFPTGSWEREDPIMLESRQMRLLFKQYQLLPDGRVNLVPCTMVLLPDRTRAAPGAAAGRTLVLRAPQGAVPKTDLFLNPEWANVLLRYWSALVPYQLAQAKPVTKTVEGK